MALGIFNDYDQGALFTVAIVAICVCVAATFLRFILASQSGRKIDWEDWFALAALLTFCAYAGCCLRIVVNLDGRSPFIRGAIPVSNLLETYKLGYAMNIQTPLNQTFAKLSLLALYYRIFGVNRNFVRMCWAVGSIQIAWCITFVCLRLFLCRPLAGGWDPLIKATCINSNLILAIGDTINSLLDFIMIGMAVWMVQKLKMNLSNKAKLSILFILGGFSGIIGIIKISEAYGTIGNSVKDATWNISQQGTSILCCCAPIYKPLLHELHVFQSRLFSYISSGGTRRSLLGKDNSDTNSDYTNNYTNNSRNYTNNYTAAREGEYNLRPLPEGGVQSAIRSSGSGEHYPEHGQRTVTVQQSVDRRV